MYTVVPPHLLEQQPDFPALSTQSFPGGCAQLWPDGRLCRIISTNPALYLDPNLAPGTHWQKPLPPGGTR